MTKSVLGIIGGSGIYDLPGLEDAREEQIRSPFGDPSGALRIGAHTVRAAELAVLEREGTELAVETTEDAVVLLLSGAPLNEPIVGHGPFVMNSREEIMQAMRDFNNGQFGQIAH